MIKCNARGRVRQTLKDNQYYDILDIYDIGITYNQYIMLYIICDCTH